MSQLSGGAFCSSREVFNCIMFLPIALIQRSMQPLAHERDLVGRQTGTQKKYTKTFWAISRPCKPCNLWSVVELGSLSKTGWAAIHAAAGQLLRELAGQLLTNRLGAIQSLAQQLAGGVADQQTKVWLADRHMPAGKLPTIWLRN